MDDEVKRILRLRKKEISALTDDELNRVREIIRPISVSAAFSNDISNTAIHVIDMIDDELSKRDWGNQEIGFPKKREHGWYL